ncbi:TNF receptor-associated factor BIRC3 binding domain containing protein [Nitzschia inconspicua]|uniref:TNF receptor-associated factor BIRC3 binding domain containing protein n=1 Tax=Nitzschia inconspicua TaxID=303405 RepID=A0A9K3L2Z4_9STRA|nr:TNF receptor-associated factor BIRC3 binding domain containing protein [Nitzschia inconspicua]
MSSIKPNGSAATGASESPKKRKFALVDVTNTNNNKITSVLLKCSKPCMTHKVIESSSTFIEKEKEEEPPKMVDEEGLREVFKIILGDELQEAKASIKALEETTKALQEGREKDGEKIKALEEGREKDGEKIKALEEKIKALEESREKDGEKIKALEEGREKDGEKIKALEEGRERDGEKIKALQEGTKQLDRTVTFLCVYVTN